MEGDMKAASRVTIGSAAGWLLFQLIGVLALPTAMPRFDDSPGNMSLDLSGFGFLAVISFVAYAFLIVAIVAGIVWIVQFVTASRPPTNNYGTIVHADGGSGPTVVVGHGARSRNINTGANSSVGNRISDSDVSSSFETLYSVVDNSRMPPAMKTRSNELLSEISTKVSEGKPRGIVGKIAELSGILKDAGELGKVTLDAISTIKGLAR